MGNQVPDLRRKPPASSTSFLSLVHGCWSPRWLTMADLKLTPKPPSLSISSLPDDILLDCLARMPRASICTVMMVCKKWQAVVQSSEFYELRQRNGRVESMLFLFGGAGTSLSSAVYCRSRGSWRAGLLCSLHSIVEDEWLIEYQSNEHALLHAQPAVIKHRIFILGALASLSKPLGLECTIIYDLWTKQIMRGAPMLCPRKKFACCVIADRILVAGGANNSDSARYAVADAEEYVPELDSWRPLASMPRRRYGCLGAAVNGIFYVIGGVKFSTMFSRSMQPFAYIRSMDSYNPKTNGWQKTRALPMGGCVIACTVMGPSIYMLSSHAVELSLWKFNTQDDTWSRIEPPPIPSPLRIDNYLRFSCASMGSSVYVVQVGGSIDDLLRRSGRSGRGCKEGLVLIYDTRAHEWSRGPDSPYMKNGAACTIVQC